MSIQKPYEGRMQNSAKQCAYSNITTRVMGLAAILALLFFAPAFAQKPPAATFPSKIIRIVIPFPPGGLPDVIARLIAPKLTESLGQPVLVDNKAGASGAIALDLLAKSSLDGHTLGMITSGSLTVDETTYDFERDFVAVSQLASNAYVLVVNSKLPVRSIQELIALAKAKPRLLTYGSSGTGGATHLANAWLASLSGVELTHVPYKGIAQAITDVAGGHVSMVFSSIQLWKTFSASGQVIGIAISSPTRQATAPDLPTIQESGVAGYQIEGWYGIIAPVAIATPNVEKLSQEFVRIMRLPDIRQKLTADGAEPVGSSSAQFGDYLRKETVKWRRIAKDAGLSVKQ